MKILFLQSEYGGAQAKGYPHSRDFVPVIRKMLNEGHEIHQVFPAYAKNGLIEKMWNDGRRAKLQEHLRLGVQVTSPEDEIKNPDIMLVYGYPWVSRGTADMIDTLKKYLNKVKKIIWVVVDYEKEMTKSGDSVLYKIIKNQHPDIYNKITTIFTTNPNIDSDNKEVYFPTTYDPFYEIPLEDIKLSEKKYTIMFGGPVGFRHELTEVIKALASFPEKPAVFYGENYAKKYRGNKSVNMYKLQKEVPSLKIVEDRIFLPYHAYIQHMSEALCALNGTWFTEIGIDGSNNYHTTRIGDALYSGAIPLHTETFTINKYTKKIKELNINLNSLEEQKKNMMDFINLTLTGTDEAYRKYIQMLRKDMTQAFGINTWYNLIERALND